MNSSIEGMALVALEMTVLTNVPHKISFRACSSISSSSASCSLSL